MDGNFTARPVLTLPRDLDTDDQLVPLRGLPAFATARASSRVRLVFDDQVAWVPLEDCVKLRASPTEPMDALRTPIYRELNATYAWPTVELPEDFKTALGRSVALSIDDKKAMLTRRSDVLQQHLMQLSRIFEEEGRKFEEGARSELFATELRPIVVRTMRDWVDFIC